MSIQVLFHTVTLFICLASQAHGRRLQLESAHINGDASKLYGHIPTTAKALAILLLQAQCADGWQGAFPGASTSTGAFTRKVCRSVKTQGLQIHSDRHSLARADISKLPDRLPVGPLPRRFVVGAGVVSAGLVGGLMVGVTADAFAAQQRATQVVARSASLKGSVTAAVEYIGSFVCVNLEFPKPDTADGAPVYLKFAVDTGAQTSTISTRIARVLNLKSAQGIIGKQVQLGDFQFGAQQIQGELEGRQLLRTTAIALPAASPVVATAGLLGLSFLNAFPGGVEFTWGNEASGPAPSITLHGDTAGIEDGIESRNLVKRVPIEVLPGTNLPSVMISVNGVAMPALLDTGSPVTLINIPAASLAGVEPINPFNYIDADVKKNWLSPSSLLPSWLTGQTRQESREQETARAAESAALAAARGDVLNIAGLQGGVSELRRSTEAASIKIGDAEFPATRVYVGNLATWFASNLPGLEPKYPYYGFGAILGMDVLKSRPGMLYRADEVFF